MAERWNSDDAGDEGGGAHFSNEGEDSKYDDGEGGPAFHDDGPAFHDGGPSFSNNEDSKYDDDGPAFHDGEDAKYASDDDGGEIKRDDDAPRVERPSGGGGDRGRGGGGGGRQPLPTSNAPAGEEVARKVDPVWLAMQAFSRRRLNDCEDMCTALLETNPRDQAVWLLKCRVLTHKQLIDDTELEEEGVAEMLLDDNATASAPRPGTSLARPGGQSRGGGFDQSIRPVSSSGRPMTGVLRPGTSARPVTGANNVQAVLRTARQGTASGARPVTALGREVRLGTASLAQHAGGPFLDIGRLNLEKIAQRQTVSKGIVDYLIFSEHNIRKALELAAHATKAADYKDWWWKARLGKCYYKLGLYRDAERQLKSAIKQQSMVETHLELSKVYLKLDLPLTALEQLEEALKSHPDEPRVVLHMARVHEMLMNGDKSIEFYKKVLELDPSHSEAMACLAANHFYTDQPELSLRYYRRLLQMGVNNVEIWNNLGLCCFYASQYDMALGCFQRALTLADDNADLWYNIGQVAIGIGDLSLAYQAFQIAKSLDATHAESFCNLGVLELRKRNVDAAVANFTSAQALAPHMFQAFYNGGLLSYKLGNFQDAFSQAKKSQAIYPGHTDTRELLDILSKHFQAL